MQAVSSNMISKHYCPNCGSFDLLKLHRSFMQKHIINAPNKLRCNACGNTINPADFDSNMPCEIPVFIDTPNPTSGVASEVDESFSEDVLPPVTEGPNLLKTSALEASQYLHEGQEKMVDETIVIKEKKGIWLYVVASILVMLGAAYAFIWMPMTSNTDEIRMDMGISEPIQTPEKAKISNMVKIDGEELAKENFIETISSKIEPEPATEVASKSHVPELTQKVTEDVPRNNHVSKEVKVEAEAFANMTTSSTDNQEVIAPSPSTSDHQDKVPSSDERTIQAASPIGGGKKQEAPEAKIEVSDTKIKPSNEVPVSLIQQDLDRLFN